MASNQAYLAGLTSASELAIIRSMLKNGRSDATRGLHAGGCSCCNKKRERRKPKKSAKRREERAWRKEQT